MVKMVLFIRGSWLRFSSVSSHGSLVLLRDDQAYEGHCLDALAERIATGSRINHGQCLQRGRGPVPRRCRPGRDNAPPCSKNVAQRGYQLGQSGEAGRGFEVEIVQRTGRDEFARGWFCRTGGDRGGPQPGCVSARFGRLGHRSCKQSWELRYAMKIRHATAELHSSRRG